MGLLYSTFMVGPCDPPRIPMHNRAHEGGAECLGGTDAQRSRNGRSCHRRDRLEPRQLVDTGRVDCARVRCRSPRERALGRSAPTVVALALGVKRAPSFFASGSCGVGAHHEEILSMCVTR